MRYSLALPVGGLATILMLSTATTGWAQSRNTEIVVTATREQQAALEEIKPERSVDEAGVSSYGASTIGEVLAVVASENGDSDEPVLFVNGVPITDPGDIVDYPAEAIERLDVLPHGAGARLGARTDRRAYNIVLKRVFSSQIVVLKDLLATDGGYNSVGGEVLISRIANQKRLNISLSARDDSALFESERGLLQPDPRYPFGLAANVIADPRAAGTEIDPTLSALVGRPVSLAGAPVGAAVPTLEDFASRADQANLTDLGRFRTLRPATRSYEASINYNQPLNNWLSVALSGRLGEDTYTSRQGLRSALFLLPPTSAFSPFGETVGVARYFANDPLLSHSSYLRGSAGAAFNATRGPWQLTLRSDYRYSRYRNRAQRQSSSGFILLDPATGANPFTEDVDGLAPFYIDRSNSTNEDTTVQFSATGPLVQVPAGALRLNANSKLRWVDQEGVSDSPFFQSRRSLSRIERAIQASVEVPLTSRKNDVLGVIGDLILTIDQGVTDVGRFGTISRQGYAVNWRPINALNVQGSINKERLLPDPGQIGEAIVFTEGTRYFDVLTGETVDVTQISGGNPNLLREAVTTKRLSATAELLSKWNLLLNGEYLSTRRDNPISNLPPASRDLVLAFPERFVRDSEGNLISVDLRPVNFSNRSTESVRWGVNFTAPLVPVPAAGVPASPKASRLRLEANLAHTINLQDEILPRPGLATVDLLRGGAIGFGGGGSRHQVDATLALNDRETGVRVSALWRSGSVLNVGAGGSADQLRFSPLLLVNVRAFIDLGEAFEDARPLKKTKLSFNVANAFNRRQTVRDQAGLTPLRYQAGYRDPVGRTVELELRKVF